MSVPTRLECAQAFSDYIARRQARGAFDPQSTALDDFVAAVTPLVTAERERIARAAETEFGESSGEFIRGLK